MTRIALAQRQNLLTYSEQFDNAAWTKTNTTVSANTADTADPSGANSADKLTDSSDGAPAAHNIYEGKVITGIGYKYTSSIYAKAGTGGQWINVFNGDSSVGAYFDLVNGVIGNQVNVVATMASAGNGWWRCSITFTGTPTSYLGVYIASANGTVTYQGSASKNYYLWGGQMVQANWAGPYTQTVAVAVNTGNIRSLAQPLTPVNLLVNGDFEGAEGSPVPGWNDYLETSSRQAGMRPGGAGKYVGRVTYSSSGGGSIFYQTILTIGKNYHAMGWARSDGVGVPRIYDTDGRVLWTGTNSTAWQKFDFVWTSGGTQFRLIATNLGAGNYVEWDDVVVYDLTATPQRLLAQPYPLVNKATDGNMEATNAAVALVDGDMETAGVANWSVSLGTRAKSAVTPHSGTQCIRLTAGTNTAQSYQNSILTAGHTYRIQGWARGDGVQGLSSIIAGGGGITTVVGTSTNTWQSFDVTVVAIGGTAFYLNASGLANGTGYVEFDDITITDVTAGSWTSDLALAYKTTSSPHSGSQALRVAYTVSGTGYGEQVCMTIGKPYKVSGWARGDGTANPFVQTGASTGVFTGTTSTSWQYFEKYIVKAGDQYLYLGASGLSAGHYVDYDDVSVIDLTATPTRLLAQPYPLTNKLVDGDMEAADTSAYGSGSAVLSKQAGQRPGSLGTKILRIARSGGNAYAQQPILTVGRRYLVKGWCRSDGTCKPYIDDGSATDVWIGTTSTSWQYVEFEYCPAFTNPRLYSVLGADGNYTEWDDVQFYDITTNPARMLA